MLNPIKQIVFITFIHSEYNEAKLTFSFHGCVTCMKLMVKRNAFIALAMKCGFESFSAGHSLTDKFVSLKNMPSYSSSVTNLFEPESSVMSEPDITQFRS